MINWVRGVCRISGWVLLVSNGLEEGSVREHDEWRTLKTLNDINTDLPKLLVVVFREQK